MDMRYGRDTVNNITFLVPTYDNPEMLYRTLGSLKINTGITNNVIVINNGGDHDTLIHHIEMANLDECSLITMNSNAGWMGALNRGLQKVETEYVCFMNDDLFFTPNSDWFGLLKIFEADKNIAAVGPITNFAMGIQRYIFMGLPEVHYSDMLVGFCVVLKTDVIKGLGGLDESLPGGDDVDMSIRLKRAGHRLAIDRRFYVHHVGQVTGKKVYGDGWNSHKYSTITNNALIRKHGVRAWFDCFETVKPREAVNV